MLLPVACMQSKNTIWIEQYTLACRHWRARVACKYGTIRLWESTDSWLCSRENIVSSKKLACRHWRASSGMQAPHHHSLTTCNFLALHQRARLCKEAACVWRRVTLGKRQACMGTSQKSLQSCRHTTGILDCVPMQRALSSSVVSRKLR